jgi:hypothetical protein
VVEAQEPRRRHRPAVAVGLDPVASRTRLLRWVGDLWRMATSVPQAMGSLIKKRRKRMRKKKHKKMLKKTRWQRRAAGK